MIELIHGDCMEYLADCKDKQFDLAIVDPPYGIGFDNKIRDNKIKKWDTEIPPKEYFDEIKKASENRIVWGANYFPYLWAEGCKGFIFWNKDINFDTYSAGELAYTSFNIPAKYFYYAWNGLADGIRGRNKKQKTIHPTQKPVELYRWLLQNYAKQGDTIIDTHSGSASIAIACYIEGFDLVCIEKDKDYFEAAKKRYEDYVAMNPIMFEPEELRQPQQTELF